MIDRESTERLRKAFEDPLQIADNGTHCPAAERLWDAAHGQLDRRAVADVLLHCGECGACAEGWRLALAGAPDRSAESPSRIRLVVAAAAVVAFASLVFLVIPKLVPKQPPVFREAEPSAIESTVGDAALPRERFVLSWTPDGSDSRYDLRVMSENLDILHLDWNLDESRFVVPPEALESLSSGSRILWQVTVRTPDEEADVSATFDAVIE